MTTDGLAVSGLAEHAFTTTHWSVVLSARDSRSAESLEALEQLCHTYWYPLYAYARRLGHNPADAEDLTQGFFCRLLEKGFLKAADQQRGRFRTFLLIAFKRFLSNEWDHQHAQKRGGFLKILPLEHEIAEARLGAENPGELPPDVLYDRHWAMALLDRTMRLVREEYVATGRASLFEYLAPCLARDESALLYSDIARRLKLTEAAVKMAVQRLRARFRELLRRQIGKTLCSSQDIEQEIRDLFGAFCE